MTEEVLIEATIASRSRVANSCVAGSSTANASLVTRSASAYSASWPLTTVLSKISSDGEESGASVVLTPVSQVTAAGMFSARASTAGAGLATSAVRAVRPSMKCCRPLATAGSAGAACRASQAVTARLPALRCRARMPRGAAPA